MSEPYCNEENFRGESLPLMDGDYIVAIIDVPGGLLNKRISTNISKDLLKEAWKKAKEDEVKRFIAYYKAYDDNGILSSYVLRLKYSPKAWKDGLDKGLGRPRVKYLLLFENDIWGNSWIEFPSSSITFTAPTDDDPYGYLCITVEGLEDPLIGGC